MAFVALNTTYQKATFEPRYDADGTVWRQAVAGDTLVAGTPVQIIYNEFGPVTLALADGTDYTYIGVPIAAAAAADVVWLQTGGYCAVITTTSTTTAVGYALECHDGTILTTGADYDGNDAEFAVSTEVSTGTPHSCVLVDRMILQST